MAPVHMRAKFCVRESDSAGRAKSAAPAATMAHFITGALWEHSEYISGEGLDLRVVVMVRVRVVCGSAVGAEIRVLVRRASGSGAQL